MNTKPKERLITDRVFAIDGREHFNYIIRVYNVDIEEFNTMLIGKVDVTKIEQVERDEEFIVLITVGCREFRKLREVLRLNDCGFQGWNTILRSERPTTTDPDIAV